MKQIDIDDATFDGFRALIYEVAGIEYPASKRTLFLNRVRRRLEVLRLETPKQYLDVLRSGAAAKAELQEFLDAVTTNETYFFRCPRHWDFFRRFVKQLDASIPASRRIRIWSAAASTGAEAYSAAICLQEEFGRERVPGRFEIHGTDLNQSVLADARKGIYNDLTLRGVEAERRARWFRQLDEGSYEVLEPLRTNITFGLHNLLDPVTHGPYDFIFLRNVMIYFDRASKTRVLKRVYDALQPGGAVLLGESESLVQVEHGFKNGETSVLLKEPETVS